MDISREELVALIDERIAAHDRTQAKALNEALDRLLYGRREVGIEMGGKVVAVAVSPRPSR